MKWLDCGAIALMVGMAGTIPMTAQKQDKAKGAIRHVVVIFQENISFDHYLRPTPTRSTLPAIHRSSLFPEHPPSMGYPEGLLRHNPNDKNPENEKGRANPFRLRRDQAATADQSHDYQAEQQAYDHGKMDLFPKSVGHPDGPRVPGEHAGAGATSGLTMGYFDGNTVTALWNYAQHFAMSDRQFGLIFGPSTPWRDQFGFGTNERGRQRSER